MSVGIAQINTQTGNLEFNAKKIAEYITKAENEKIDLVVFPALALTGCLIDDILKRHPQILSETQKWLNGLAKLTKNTTAIVGFMAAESSAAILRNGKIERIIKKAEPNKILIKNQTYSISIEDNITKCDTDVIINCTAIPVFESQEFISKKAKALKTPIIFANQVGATDNISFSGKSSVFNKNGQLIAAANAYKEDFIIINDIESAKVLDKQSKMKTQTEFSLDYESELAETYQVIIQGIRDYFTKCGLKRAVLGLSGGLDSTVCAVLLADALGKENVYGISMPSKLTSNESKSDAAELANNLGINFAEATIKHIVDTTTECFNELFENIEKNWQDRYTKSFTPDNIQARARATYLWGVSNEFPSCIPIATSDKSEAYMGYATINGDMSGGFAPIADVTKTKLFALARWLNKNRAEKNVIPESVIRKRPGAELAIDPKTGKTLCAEDALMPYEFLDEIIWRIENKKESYEDMMTTKFLYEKKNNISKEQKIEWLDKFYRRMSSALYKWSIMPPSVVINQNTINKAVYNQPITSGKINYKCVSEAYIEKSLIDQDL